MSGSESESEEEFSEEEGTYTGEYNEKGEYEGEGVLRFEKSNVYYEGTFHCGMKQGFGTMHFPEGSYMKGQWVDDALEGEGEYHYEDGGKLISSNWKGGSVCGEAEEFDPDSNLVFRGYFADGVRHGEGQMYFREGTSIKGVWEEGGISEQKETVYFYPDSSSLRAYWKDGELTDAKYVDKSGKEAANVLFSEDISTDTCIGLNPLLKDPYESQYVYVKESTTKGAGQGLFALQDIPADFICSLYNGIRISHAVVDGRDWEENKNTISLDDDLVIDVPQSENNLSVYCATLGHKANHSQHPNAKYDIYFDHPRFGKIKCIRTISPIKRGEEIFVDYGYETEAPDWYLSLNERPPSSHSAKKQKTI